MNYLNKFTLIIAIWMVFFNDCALFLFCLNMPPNRVISSSDLIFTKLAEVSFKKWLPQTVTWNFEVGSFFPERMFQDVRYANAKLLAAEGLWASQGPHKLNGSRHSEIRLILLALGMVINPSNAMATFVQNTKMQRFLTNI